MLPCCSCLQWGQRQASSGASWRRGRRQSEEQQEPFPGPTSPSFQARQSERSAAMARLGGREWPSPSCNPAVLLPALQRRSAAGGGLWSKKHAVLLPAAPSRLQSTEFNAISRSKSDKAEKGAGLRRKALGAGIFERREPGRGKASQRTRGATDLPAPLWCRAGNTGLRCRTAAAGAAPSAGGHSRHQGCTHPGC